MIFGLAPMDGITNLPYRTIVNNVFSNYGPQQPDTQIRNRTEFMNVDWYMIQPHKLVHHLIHHDDEKQLIAQLYGGNKDTLVQSVIDIQEKYPQFMGIELNIWCPSPRVMVCGGWSWMMKHKERTLDIIKSMSNVATLPFSIKVRTGVNEEDKKDRYVILLQAAPYVHCISIHGRTIKQWHSGQVDRNYIHRFKQEVWDTCLVIGNGGITTHAEALHYVQTPLPFDGHNTTSTSEISYGIDGIMVWQAAIADPWIFTGHTPSTQERYETIMEHLYLAVAYEIWSQIHVNEPDEDMSINKKYLHAFKKYDPNSDEAYDLPPLVRHKYSITMPTIDELNAIIETIKKDPTLTSFNLTPTETRRHALHTPTTFRKYLFNYIKWLPGSKELKIKAAKITEYTELFYAIKEYFNQEL